jgi:FMN-dependent NADH-azoreductase
MNILHIDCSPRRESHSRRLSAAIVEEILGILPGACIIRRDLGAAPLPHAPADYAATLSSPLTLAEPIRGSLDLAEALIAEIEAADVIVIGTPVHNLTIPSVLKAWIDQVLRAGRTMMTTSAGNVGMLRDRPVFIGVASGSAFKGPRATQPDFLTPYLSEVLRSIGLKSLQFLWIEGTAFLEGVAAARALENALAELDLSRPAGLRRPSRWTRSRPVSARWSLLEGSPVEPGRIGLQDRHQGHMS